MTVFARRVGDAVSVQHRHLDPGRSRPPASRRLARGLCLPVGSDAAGARDQPGVLPLVDGLGEVGHLHRVGAAGRGVRRPVEVDADDVRPGLVGGGREGQQRPRAGGLPAGADDRDAVSRSRRACVLMNGMSVTEMPWKRRRRARLERAQEHLLAGLAVEVVVGVPVAREGQRIGAVQLLVAGLHVDRREARVLGLGERVVVVLVDVHVDAAERVNELLESREVDVQEVVRA